MSWAIVHTDIAPLYTKPEPLCELADEALYGMVVEILEEAGGYYRVRTHYRYEGYVPGACLLRDDSAARAWNGAVKMVAAKPYIDVLSAPKVQGGCLQSLPRGGVISPVGVPDAAQWQQVRLVDGRLGYAKSTSLAPYIAPDGYTGGDSPYRPREAALRRALCEAARAYLGAQYRWGGKTPLGIDCSGLVSMAYLLNGIVIYRDANIKPGFALHEITLDQAKEGDLLFFPGHVAMYLGEGKFIHATAHPGSEGVVLSSLRSHDADYRPDLKENLNAVGSVF